MTVVSKNMTVDNVSSSMQARGLLPLAEQDASVYSVSIPGHWSYLRGDETMAALRIQPLSHLFVHVQLPGGGKLLASGARKPFVIPLI